MRDAIHLTKAFLKNPRHVGTMFPSSAVLARKMAADLPAGKSGAVLELGPGTGALTTALASAMGADACYLGVDLNPDFVAILKQRFPRLRFVCGSAHEVERHMADHGMAEVRAIISGLPFASLPSPVQDGIIDGLVRLMKPGVEFRTFQYVHALRLPAARRFRREMTQRFGSPKISKPVMWNIPPAVVLTWTGK